jgi:flagellar protein FliS
MVSIGNRRGEIMSNISKVVEVSEMRNVKMVSQLLEGADTMLVEAGAAITEDNLEQENIYSSQSVAIFKALQEGLDEIKGGEIARNLYNLYTYMIERIMSGFQSRDHNYVEEVRALLRKLIEGWNGMDSAVEVDAAA